MPMGLPGGRPGPFRSIIGAPDLSVLADAYGVRGGLGDPGVLRSDAGVYLMADTSSVMRLRATRTFRDEAVVSVAAAAVTRQALAISPLQEDMVLWGISVNQPFGQVVAYSLWAQLPEPPVPIADRPDIPLWYAIGDSSAGIDTGVFVPTGETRELAPMPILLRRGTKLDYVGRNFDAGGGIDLTFRTLWGEARHGGVHPVSR